MSSRPAVKTIHITVHLDAKALRRFTVFNTFRRQRKWHLPLLFTLILTGFSICLFAAGKGDRGSFLGSLLMLIGLGLPIVYIGTFLSQVKAAVKKYRLPRDVYELDLSPEAVTIRSCINVQEEQQLEWKSLYAVCRVKGAVYMYATAAKAFLLPYGQADTGDDALWAYLKWKLPGEKCFDYLKKKG